MKANTTLQLMSFLLAMASSGPLFAESCPREERPAILIHYDANINDGMTLVQDIQRTEERVGGSLGYNRLVLVRSANAQRFAMFGYRLAIARTKTDTIPALKRIRSKLFNIRTESMQLDYELPSRRGSARGDDDVFGVMGAKRVLGLLSPVFDNVKKPPDSHVIAEVECDRISVSLPDGRWLDQCVASVAGYRVALSGSWQPLMPGGERQWFRATSVAPQACASDEEFAKPAWLGRNR